MSLMARGALKLLMAWLLAGPPALCRAGVLVECCDHASTKTANSSAHVSAPCCGDCGTNSKSEKPAPDPVPRQCGTCAGVCATVVKPVDDANPTTFAVFLAIPAHVASDGQPATDTGYLDPHSYRIANLPYPPSDLPLLI